MRRREEFGDTNALILHAGSRPTIQNAMKKIIPILFCLTLMASVVRAEKFTLLAALMWESGTNGPTASTVYILQFPGNTRRSEVFKTFDSKIMEDSLSGLPRGSVVVFDINTWGHVIPPAQCAQFESLKACCKKQGVSLTLPNWGD